MKTTSEIQAERFTALLKREIGPQMLAALGDPATTDLMVNAGVTSGSTPTAGECTGPTSP